jgi:hypothetical protein
VAAHPQAEVDHRGRRVRVVARLASDVEFAAIQSLAREVYPGSDAYVRRVRNRQLRVFVLAAEVVLSPDLVQQPVVLTPVGPTRGEEPAH